MDSTKYVLLSGGCISGLGKGSILSGIGRALQDRGKRVTVVKIDPYLNEDAGGMAPCEHGEVFVLGDGGEVDQDFGSYERELRLCLTRENNITTGKIWRRILDKERKGFYLGKTVQYFPHVVSEITSWLEKSARIPVDGTEISPNICLIELGGGYTSYEVGIFLETLGRIKENVGVENFIHLHLDMLVEFAGSTKTLPIQGAIRELKKKGLRPDILLFRGQQRGGAILSKLSTTCNLAEKAIFQVPFLKNRRDLPGFIAKSGLVDAVEEQLRLKPGKIRGLLTEWERLCSSTPVESVRIGIVGKYSENKDAYASMVSALEDSGLRLCLRVDLEILDAERLEKELREGCIEETSEYAKLVAMDGILIAGGFGKRGVEGKIDVCRYAREKRKVYLGVCLGMQIMIIESARNLLGYQDASSTEFDPQTTKPVISFAVDSKHVEGGASMCLGARPGRFVSRDSQTARIYGGEYVPERHRHRYEMNPAYVAALEESGLHVSMVDDLSNMPLSVERRDHPFMIGTQSHPEFTSSVYRPSPLYLGFLSAAISQKKSSGTSQ